MQTFLHENPGLRQRRDNIVKDFYASFDPSWLWQEWNRAEQSARTLVSGEGRHFRSYRIRGRTTLDLALNVAKPQFHRSSPIDRREWIGLMRKLKAVNHPLLPPTEVLSEQDDERLLIIQPYCEEALSLSEMPALRPLLSELEELLAREGLMLDDYWQLRNCRGHPFVIDFSELKRTAVDRDKTRLTLRKDAPKLSRS